MKINLIGKSFDINSGQGIFRYSGELLNKLKEKGCDVEINKEGNINHVQQPELIWKALFKKNVITTIHDIIPIIYGERKFLFRVFFFFSILLTLTKSKKIIADSENTKKDIERIFPFGGGKILVIYGGANHKNFYPLKKRKKNKNFVIGYVGGLGKRKNVEIILKVAKKMEKEKVLFKIAGNGPEIKRLKELAKKMNLKNIEFVGFVPEKKLNKFYNSLDLFVFPSLYEGFGLPVLEAMACGIPVITSNKASLPEIVGEAGLLVDPANVSEIKKAIEKVIKNKKLQKKLREKSIKQASKFSWENCAKDTYKIYREILK